jgi:hypothetical protein
MPSSGRKHGNPRDREFARQLLFSVGKARLAEIGRLCSRRMVVQQLGVAGDDQERGEMRGNDEHTPGSKMTQVKFIELSGGRQSFDSDPERELRCMVSGQRLIPLRANAARQTTICAWLLAKSKNAARRHVRLAGGWHRRPAHWQKMQERLERDQAGTERGSPQGRLTSDCLNF